MNLKQFKRNQYKSLLCSYFSERLSVITVLVLESDLHTRMASNVWLA